MNIAETVSQRGDCRRSHVGAVIVDTQHRIVSTGYNGVAAGQEGCLDGKCPRGLKTFATQEKFRGGIIADCVAIHAEVNALLYSDRTRHEGGTLYVNKIPCYDCLRTMEAGGIQQVVYLDHHDIVCDIPVADWRLYAASESGLIPTADDFVTRQDDEKAGAPVL